MENLKLTDAQDRAVNQAIDWYNQPKHSEQERMMALIGGAGVGKTVTTNAIIQELKKLRGKGLQMGTTHKIVGVQHLMAKKYGIRGVDRMTVHRFLGCRLEEDEDVIPKMVIQKDKCLMPIYQWGIVDEAGMINSRLFNHKTSEMRRLLCQNYHTLFVGDDAQLKPVGEGLSPVFSVPFRIELDEVIRQAEDSPIIDAILYCREVVLNGKKIELGRFEENHSHDFSQPGLWKLHHEEWMEQVIEIMSSCEYKQNSDTAKVICFQNKVALHLNLQIRERLYQGAEAYQVGEPMIAASTIRDPFDENIILISNSEDVVITYSRPTTLEYDDFPKFGAYIVKVRCCQTGDYRQLTCIEPYEKPAFAQALNQLADQAQRLRDEGKYHQSKALWRKFYQIRRKVAELIPPYVITVRRSQGSTYPVVLPYMNDLLLGYDFDDIARRVYVALSRAQEQILMRV
jgi:exodeoxyribonuclease-5